MNRRAFIFSTLSLGAAAAISVTPLHAAAIALGGGKRRKGAKTTATAARNNGAVGRVVKTDAEWKRILTPEQYVVTRQKGTEAPGSSPLNSIHEAGVFECVSCDLPIFSSQTKFESGTGWPSFYAPIAKQNVHEEVDKSLGEARTEVLCARCDAHLGHVFDDGPRPTGLRYCMNGVALKFVKKPQA